MREILPRENDQTRDVATSRSSASVIATRCLGTIGAKATSNGKTGSKQLHEWFLLIREADGCSERSLAWFNNCFKDLLDFCRNEGYPLDLAELESEHLIAWLVHLRNRPHKNPKKIGKLKQNTLNNYWRGVKRFYRWAYENKKIDQDPTQGIKGPKANRPLISTFKEHHVAAMLDLCPPNTLWGVRDRGLILTFLRTGLRLEELASMQISELDFKRHVAKVRGKGKRGEGSKERIVYIDNQVTKALLGWLMVRPSRGTDALWTTLDGNPLTAKAIRLVISRIAGKIGATDVRVSPHTFRHTYAVNLLREGKDIRFVQEALGHEDIESTQIYVRTLTQEDALEWRKGIDPFKGWRRL